MINPTDRFGIDQPALAPQQHVHAAVTERTRVSAISLIRFIRTARPERLDR
jgi:hypothetical protein